jgi:hypothetical protein
MERGVFPPGSATALSLPNLAYTAQGPEVDSPHNLAGLWLPSAFPHLLANLPRVMPAVDPVKFSPLPGC